MIEIYIFYKINSECSVIVKTAERNAIAREKLCAVIFPKNQWKNGVESVPESCF